ncbi:MAG: class III signal peptide-containing protein [Candidatus Micrarchaeota archaeon]
MEKKRAQTSLEYMLMVGGVLAFVAIVLILTRGNIFSTSQSNIENQTTTLGDVLASIPGKAPVISNLLPTAPGLGTALVTWETDINADSYLQYAGLAQGNLRDSNYVTSHSLTFNGPSGAYDFKVTSCTPQGGCSTMSGSVVI